MNDLAPALAFALLHSLWQGALLAGAAALTLRAMVRASAAARHGVAMTFLIAMILAPVAQIVIYANADAPLQAGAFAALFDPMFGKIAAPLMIAAWGGGVAFMLARHIVGFQTIIAMEQTVPVEPPQIWLDRTEEMRAALRIAQAVSVRLTDAVLTPCVTYIIRPIIWVPVSLITGTPAKQLEALLAHELAHIARKDWLWSGSQNAIEALLFYHPAVWWLGKRIRQEREHACDDLAVAACGDAIALAEGLAALERTRQTAPHFGLAASGGALLRRIGRLLSTEPSRARRGVLATLGAMALAGALFMGQVSAGGGQPHDMRVEASTSGALGPRDHRQIIATGDDMERFYRASVDSNGRLTEVYRENGHDRPIDAHVRAWLKSVSP